MRRAPLSEGGQQQRLQAYYRLQSRIYDATRWSFLFGRNKLVELIVARAPRRILEIGCGTGHMLDRLAERLPETQLTGVDLSEDMLARAQTKLARHGDRVQLIRGAYREGMAGEAPDLILLSYALTMMHPGEGTILDQVSQDLAPGGAVAVVDFHDSAWSPFRRWMAVNHVVMQGQTLRALERRFLPDRVRVGRAYLGLWRYFFFLGRASAS